MRRNFRLTIRYDGTRYQGWQKQKKTEQTIQGKLETLLGRMLQSELQGEERDGSFCHLTSEEFTDDADKKQPEKEKNTVQVIGAGRTDAGVHAQAMTANVFLATEKSPEELRDYLNTYLPEDISIDVVTIASDRFHSRYNAIGKTYCYSCYCGAGKPVFDRKYVTVLEGRPDVARMRQAASFMIGNQDFKAFCGNPKMKKPTVRRVDEIRICEEGDYLRIYFHGNGFLQNMVRIMTGTLLEVGFSRMEPEFVKEILSSKERAKAGPTAPACGLCQIRVDYD